MIIHLIFDPSTINAPNGFTGQIQTAANLMQQAFVDNITINIRVGWGEINDQAILPFNGSLSYALGGPSYGAYLSYQNLRNALTSVNEPRSADDSAAIASLPNSNSVFPNSANTFYLASAQEKALGLISGTASAVDGAIGFGTGWTSNWIGGALHETTHAMGRTTAYYEGGTPTIMDLYRYDAAGHYQWNGGSTAFFSTDGGHTPLAYFGTNSDYGDLANSFTPSDPFDESVTSNSLTAVDLTIMDVLGFDRAGTSPPPTDDYRNSLTDLSHPFGTVAVNGSSTGTLEVAGDRDWFSVQLVAGTTYTIRLLGAASGNGTLTDPYLRLHDNAGTLLAQNDDSGGTLESQLSFTPATTGTYYLDVGAYNDGLTGTYRVSVAAPNHAPVLTVVSANVAATAGQSFSAASLFSATDADGNLQGYYLYDANSAASSGHFVVNGTVVPSEYVYWISAAQLAQTSFVAGAGGTSDELRVIAYDGQTYSNNSVFTYFHVNVANHAPVLTVPSANVAATAHQTLSAASLFGATDADGNLQGYYLYDANSAASSGHFVVNGTVVPSEYVYWISAAQLAQTSFVAGAGGTSDELRVIAYDGQTYSNNSIFTYLHVNVAASPAGPAAGGAPTTGNDNFVFASGLGQKTGVDFSQGFADNHLLHTDLSADHFKQIFGAGVVASIDATSDVGAHREAAVDLLALFGLHATDHTTGHI